MKIQVRAEIELTAVPDFFRMTDGKMLPIEAIPEEDLRRIGDHWTESLINRAKEKSNNQIQVK